MSSKPAIRTCQRAAAAPVNPIDDEDDFEHFRCLAVLRCRSAGASAPTDVSTAGIVPVMAAVLAVGIGAALGALLRWVLGSWLNAMLPALPLGTLVANLVGGYLVGVAVVLLAPAAGLPPEWRLFAITGFLGGLTTFSTFSAEVVHALQQGRLVWAAATVAAHVIGSLALTVAGMATADWLKR